MGWVKCLSVYAGAGRGDRGDGRSAVSGSSARGGYGNMEQLSAAQTNQGASVNNVIITSVFYDHILLNISIWCTTTETLIYF